MANTIDFTNRALEALKPPAAGRDEYKDSKAPGLYIRVTAGGIKTFSFVGRPKGSSRVERLTLGKYPIVKADEARRLATKLAGDLAAGSSPANAARQRRAEPTLAETFPLYVESKRLRGRKAIAQDEDAWRLYIEPAFGGRRLSEISGTAIERWHRLIPAQVMARRQEQAAAAHQRAQAEAERRAASRALRRRGPDRKPRDVESAPAARKVTGHRTANVALSVLRSFFNWAMAPRQGLFAGPNPAAGHELFDEASRERFLRPDELAPFFQALADLPNPTMRDFILIALLTGARRSNVAAMAWADVDLERAEWRVPGAEMKNGQAQTITLTPEAIGILRNRLVARRPTPARATTLTTRDRLMLSFVFPSPDSESGHIEDPRRAWSRTLRAARIADMTLHDLRRTLGSWQARTGASLVLIGKSLNHKDHQSTAIYARLDLDPVRQSVERATSAMFEAAGLKPAAPVMPLPNPTTKGSTRRAGADAGAWMPVSKDRAAR